MSPFWIDTDRARRVITAWAERADGWFRFRFDLEGDFVELHLTGSSSAGSAPVLHHLAVASAELWVNVSFVRLLLDRVDASDRFDGVDPGTLLELRRRAGDHARMASSIGRTDVRAGDHFSSRFGDVGQTYESELRSPYSIAGSTPTERGRNLVWRALADTLDEVQIRADEFELVRFADGRYLVVLPGVTDLSQLELGLNQRHRTVRDVDRFAYDSSRSAAVGDNRYAAMVWQALRTAGVPIGAQLMIVGHSYGADSALDLASDRSFNGAAGFDVTHVVAAGYHSGPQLEHVDPRTEVLVLQNYRDTAVIAEALGYGPITEAVEGAGRMLGDVRDLDPMGVVGDAADVMADVANAASAATGLAVQRAGALGRLAGGLLVGRPNWVLSGAVGAVTLEPGVERIAERQVVDVFRGGSEGLGHAQANYVEHVATTDDRDVEAFFESVAANGYAASGTAWAIDVSVPLEE